MDKNKKNTKKEKDCLEEKDIIKDCLITQKYLTEAYNNYSHNLTNKTVRDEILNILNEEHMIKNEVYQEIEKRGFAKKPEEAKKDEIEKYIFQFKEELSNL